MGFVGWELEGCNSALRFLFVDQPLWLMALWDETGLCRKAIFQPPQYCFFAHALTASNTLKITRYRVGNLKHCFSPTTWWKLSHTRCCPGTPTPTHLLESPCPRNSLLSVSLRRTLWQRTVGTTMLLYIPGMKFLEDALGMIPLERHSWHDALLKHFQEWHACVKLFYDPLGAWHSWRLLVWRSSMAVVRAQSWRETVWKDTFANPWCDTLSEDDVCDTSKRCACHTKCTALPVCHSPVSEFPKHGTERYFWSHFCCLSACKVLRDHARTVADGCGPERDAERTNPCRQPESGFRKSSPAPGRKATSQRYFPIFALRQTKYILARNKAVPLPLSGCSLCHESRKPETGNPKSTTNTRNIVQNLWPPAPTRDAVAAVDFCQTATSCAEDPQMVICAVHLFHRWKRAQMLRCGMTNSSRHFPARWQEWCMSHWITKWTVDSQ